MRKIIGGILAIVMIVSMMAGCRNRVEIPEGEPIITETVPTETPTESTEIVEEVKWDVPDEEYVIDISHHAETDLEKIAWVI